MREYVAIVRAILRGEPPPPGRRSGRRHFQLSGLGPFPDLPIYIAALSPNMLQLAGEIADGVILWLCNPAYIRDVVVPAVREGREKAGKTLEGFDIDRRRPGRRDRRRRRRVRGDAPRPDPLLRAAVLPRDARALGLRGGHRRLRRRRRRRRRRWRARSPTTSSATLTAVGDDGRGPRPASSATSTPARRRRASARSRRRTSTRRCAPAPRPDDARGRPRPPRRACSSASWQRFAGAHPRSRELYERARGSLIGGVPMPWMMRWAGGYPVFAAHARGRADHRRRRPRVRRPRLGDTGAMAGHSPAPTVAATAQPGGAGHHDDAADRGRAGSARS